MPSPESVSRLQVMVAAGALAILWLLESWVPFMIERRQRLRHAFRNLAVGGLNAIVLAVVFAAAMAGVSRWVANAHVGLLHQLHLPSAVSLVVAIVLLDGLMYLWHRANHWIPFLWRFHRMHHSDSEMDVTTACRFHTGEIALSALLRLAIIPVLGLELWQVILYDTLLLPVIALHHSNVDLPERWDRWLRLVIVSPGVHRVHHSDWRPETNSNYSSIFSWWDRLGRTFRLREDLRRLRYGLRELDGEEWQRLPGLLRTPLADLGGTWVAASVAPGEKDGKRLAI